MSPFGQLRAHLDGITTWVWRSCEYADAELDGLNDRLRRLADTGLFETSVVYGQVVLTRPYAVGGLTASGQAIQAVLTLPHGFGAVYWDTESWAELDENDNRDLIALNAVIPYGECEPAVRALLAPHAAPLLKK